MCYRLLSSGNTGWRGGRGNDVEDILFASGCLCLSASLSLTNAFNVSLPASLAEGSPGNNIVGLLSHGEFLGDKLVW